GTELVLVHRDEVADHAFVELERALELRQDLPLRGEAGDDVIAGFLVLDLVGELAATPVVQGGGRSETEQAVVLLDLLGNGGVFECGIEDVHRLVFTRQCGNPPFGRYRPPRVADAGGEWGGPKGQPCLGSTGT